MFKHNLLEFTYLPKSNVLFISRGKFLHIHFIYLPVICFQVRNLRAPFKALNLLVTTHFPEAQIQSHLLWKEGLETHTICIWELMFPSVIHSERQEVRGTIDRGYCGLSWHPVPCHAPSCVRHRLTHLRPNVLILQQKLWKNIYLLYLFARLRLCLWIFACIQEVISRRQASISQTFPPVLSLASNTEYAKIFPWTHRILKKLKILKGQVAYKLF